METQTNNAGYNPEIRQYLNANNREATAVLNSQFKPWESHIITNVVERNSDDDRYESEDNQRLLKRCKGHSETYQKPIDTENIVLLTHPFYLNLSHMNQLSKNQRLEAAEYTDKLFGLFDNQSIRKNAGIVLLETLHHYAAFTSSLLELGLVDRVIFSLYDNGILLDNSELKEFSTRNFYIGGGYNEACLSSSIREVQKAVKSQEQVWAIKDICLQFPLSDDAHLMPEVIYEGFSEDDCIPENRTITLDQLADKLNAEAQFAYA